MPLFDVRPGQDGAVYLAGEFDMASVEAFMTAVGKRLVPHRPIVLDLADLTFIDSTGLQCFLMLSEEYAVTLRRPQPQVRRLLAVADLDGWPGITIED